MGSYLGQLTPPAAAMSVFSARARSELMWVHLLRLKNDTIQFQCRSVTCCIYTYMLSWNRACWQARLPGISANVPDSNSVTRIYSTQRPSRDQTTPATAIQDHSLYAKTCTTKTNNHMLHVYQRLTIHSHNKTKTLADYM